MQVLSTYSYGLQMSNADFEKLSNFIFREYGIKMPPVKKTMLESRLHKRIRSLNMSSFNEYCDFIFSAEGQRSELIHMIDVVTTNKTDFFRESAHFDFMIEKVVPDLIQRDIRQVKIWSAGCSSGEEAYTISMVMQECLEDLSQFNFSILGTDISTQILEKAEKAVYPLDKAEVIPMNLKKKYLLKSRDKINPTIKIDSVIRNRVSFHRLNFMDEFYKDIANDFDIIFCRNVLIYFDKNTQKQVITKLCNKLKSGGYFFLGHSESLAGMDVPLEQLKPTIFRKI